MNLVYSFRPRIGPVVKAWKIERQGMISGGLKTCRTIALEGTWPQWAARAKESLGKKGYKVREGENFLYANKHLAGLWGVLAFHFSFFIILLGIAISLTTRFEGQIELVAGQSFQDEESSYIVSRNGFLAAGHDPRYGFRVNQLTAKYWAPQNLRFIGSDVEIYWQGKEVARGTIGYNEPLEYQGYVLYQGRYHGWAALFGIKPPGAESYMEGYVNFPMPPKGEDISKNHFTPPYADIEVIGAIVDKKDSSDAPEWMDIRLRVQGSEEDLGRIRPGETIMLGGAELKLVRFSPWSSYLIVRDYGVNVIFTGFWTAVGSLVLLFFWVPKSVLLALKYEDDGRAVISVAGKTSRYGPAFRQELEDLTLNLKDR